MPSPLFLTAATIDTAARAHTLRLQSFTHLKSEIHLHNCSFILTEQSSLLS